MTTVKWNVINYNINRDQMETLDIFKHYKFDEFVHKHLKKCKTKEEFADKLRSELMYYFWSKAEYEIIVCMEEDRVYIVPWVGSRDPEKSKIDVTDDPDFDWKGFAKKHIERQLYRNKAKIDIFDQVQYRWDEFVEYCWSQKKTRKRRKNDETEI